MEEGIIPGGGAAIYAGQGLAKLQAANDDQLVGINIVKKQFRLQHGRLPKMRERMARYRGQTTESRDTNWGYDAQEGKFRDLVKAGIIDYKVVRTALRKRSVCCRTFGYHRSNGR